MKFAARLGVYVLLGLICASIGIVAAGWEAAQQRAQLQTALDNQQDPDPEDCVDFVPLKKTATGGILGMNCPGHSWFLELRKR